MESTHDALAQPPNMPRRDVSWGRRLIAKRRDPRGGGAAGAAFRHVRSWPERDTHCGNAYARSARHLDVAPHLANQPAPPMLEPSETHIPSCSSAGIAGAHFAYVFRRSDDAGATWRNLSVPDSILGAFTLGHIAILGGPGKREERHRHTHAFARRRPRRTAQRARCDRRLRTAGRCNGECALLRHRGLSTPVFQRRWRRTLD